MTAKVWQHSEEVVVLFKAELATSHMKHGSVCKRNQSLRKSRLKAGFSVWVLSYYQLPLIKKVTKTPERK